MVRGLRDYENWQGLGAISKRMDIRSCALVSDGLERPDRCGQRLALTLCVTDRARGASTNLRRSHCLIPRCLPRFGGLRSCRSHESDSRAAVGV